MPEQAAAMRLKARPSPARSMSPMKTKWSMAQCRPRLALGYKIKARL